MSERFGDAAARLSSVASMLLGWRPEEFWSATPAEIALALQAPKEGVETPGAETIAWLQSRFPDETKA